MNHLFFAEGRIPFICGGKDDEDYTDLCYKYVAALDEWEVSGTMAEERGYGGYGSSESWGLVMGGGYNFGTGYLSSVATTVNGQALGSLPDLPNRDDQQCLAVIDDEKIFTSGGDQNPSDAFIFSKSTNSWSR